MRMLLLAAAVTMLTGPLAAYGAPGVIQLSQSGAAVLPQSAAFGRSIAVPSANLPPAIPVQPERFIGTFPLHNGLLPNGLMPNSPTYG